MNWRYKYGSLFTSRIYDLYKEKMVDLGRLGRGMAIIYGLGCAGSGPRAPNDGSACEIVI